MENKPADITECPLVLLRHFELFSWEESVSNKKLQLLEHLLSQNKQVIILSSRSFDSMAINGKGFKETTTLQERWSNVLNNFYTLYHRWKRPEKDDIDQEGQEIKREFLQFLNTKLANAKELSKVNKYCEQQTNLLFKRFEKECEHSEFLWGLRPLMLEFLKENRENYLNMEFRHNSFHHMAFVINQHFNRFYEQVCLKVQ
ncbi:MAG: hypothetical protein ACJ748_02355, partial [Flavisolibacter sp.]